jgi:hypothetical protein
MRLPPDAYCEEQVHFSEDKYYFSLDNLLLTINGTISAEIRVTKCNITMVAGSYCLTVTANTDFKPIAWKRVPSATDSVVAIVKSTPYVLVESVVIKTISCNVQ